jgi:hypothetical protein
MEKLAAKPVKDSAVDDHTYKVFPNDLKFIWHLLLAG